MPERTRTPSTIRVNNVTVNLGLKKHEAIVVFHGHLVGIDTPYEFPIPVDLSKYADTSLSVELMIKYAKRDLLTGITDWAKQLVEE